MTALKIRKVGNSLGVIFPKEIQEALEVLAVLPVGLLHREQAVVKANLGLVGVSDRCPVDGGLDLPPGSGVAGFRGEVDGAAQLDDLSGGVLHHADAHEDVNKKVVVSKYNVYFFIFFKPN